ncbi:hypothetical protein CPCC7001_521 [Cyanobium sp. PCC 7001]|uniref:hypothetical protein n=1 Tax=Cyanobium sp. PCC 7001 TaxID=180281 RepID=UPI0001804DCC|nr:hypothetical protein [Cyanobium sp. PCC 7001]EDY37642.1 hypothetical protein CPCC7001_521 [Cyanobium sp. PCC 7001]
MEHLTMVTRLAHARIATPIADFYLLWPPDQEIQGESHLAESADLTDRGQVATLEGHHHQDVGIGIPARRHEPEVSAWWSWASSSRGFQEQATVPWALPVPLSVQGRYSRAEIEAAYCCAETLRLRAGTP